MALFERRCSIKTKHLSNNEATTAPMGDAEERPWVSLRSLLQIQHQMANNF